MKDIIQFAIDIEDNNITEEKIKEILECAGVEVLGASWKARWKEEDYWEGKLPYSCD